VVAWTGALAQSIEPKVSRGIGERAFLDLARGQILPVLAWSLSFVVKPIVLAYGSWGQVSLATSFSLWTHPLHDPFDDPIEPLYLSVDLAGHRSAPSGPHACAHPSPGRQRDVCVGGPTRSLRTPQIRRSAALAL
jgi:hypothetical protein